MAVGRAIRAGQGFFELFADDSKLVRGLRHAQRRLRQFGKSAAKIGASITGFGIAAATPFALSAKTFATFEQSMAKVKAFTKDLTDNEFADLNAMAKKLGATTVFSASQAAEAMSVFALAGFSAQKNLEAIGPALELAATGGVEVAEAANIAIGIMSGMQLEASELTNVVDVMAKAMTTAANTDIPALGEAFQYIGPIGNFAGASIEELGAAIQILSNNMIAGEQAGSSLRGIYLALGSQSEQAAKELKRLNISVADANKNIRPLADIVADFESAIGDLGSAEQLDVIGKIFPARQATAFAALLATGSKELKAFTGELQNADGTASRISKTLLDTLKGDFTILLSALEGVAIAIGEAFGTELRGAIRGVSGFLSVLSELIQQNKQFILAIVGGIAVFTAFGVALGAVGVAVQLAAFALGGLATIFTTFSAIGLALLSPIGLLTAAVIGIAAAFTNWRSVMDSVVSFVMTRFGALIETVSNTITAVRDALARGDTILAAKVMMAGIQAVIARGIGFIQNKWAQLKAFMQTAWASVTYSIAGGMVSALSSLQSAWVVTVNFMLNTWSKMASKVQDIWFSAQNKISEAILKGQGLLDPNFDTEGALEQLNKQYDRDRKARLKGFGDDVAQRDAEAQGKLNEIAQSRENMMDALQQGLQQEQDSIAQASENAIAAADKRLDEANAALQAAIAEVKAAPAPGEGDDTISDAIRSVERVASKLSVGGGSVVSGGFNIASLARSFGGTEQKRTAKATEQTAKNTEKMLNNWINPLLVK